MTQQYAHHYPESLRNGVDVLNVQRPMSTQSAQPPGVPPSLRQVGMSTLGS